MPIHRTGLGIIGVVLSLLPLGISNSTALAQAPSPARDASAPAASASSARQIGTIQTIDATSLTLTTDKGEKVSVGLNGETKVVQLPAGSTDLKSAQPAAMTDVAVGDRVLAIGMPADATTTWTARRLVLMKSTDIAKRHEAEQAGWQHSSGGIVSSVNLASGTVMVTSGTRTVSVATSPSTILRRYAPSSTRFEDATRSSLGELHPGDQLRVRGERAEDGSIKADEIVSGSFRTLSGTIQSINAAAGEVTVKDLKTQRPATLAVSSGTAIHELPPEVAARFAARAKGAGAPSSPAAAHPAAPPSTAAASEGAGSRGAGGDLSQVVARLPALTLADLKVGAAVMVVGGISGAGSITAITILGGVEPILAASPRGDADIALSPWSVGGGGGEAAGGGGSQ